MKATGWIAGALTVAAFATGCASPTNRESTPDIVIPAEVVPGGAAQPDDPALPAVDDRRSVTLSRRDSTVVTGRGDMDIQLQPQGERFAVVGDFECRDCTGQTVLSTARRSSLEPLHRADGSTKGSYILTVTADEGYETIQVRARGPWKLRLYDWSLSRRVAGTYSGNGSAVIAYSIQRSRIAWSFTPAYPGDVMVVRTRSLGSNVIRSFTVTSRGEGLAELQLPAVIAVETSGSWELTPT